MNRSLDYQKQDVLSSSPIQLIIKLYDVAIASCFRGDRVRLRKALVELISALDMEEGGEFVGRLYRLYEFCMDQSVNGDLDEIRELLTDLRDAWKQADVKEAA